MNYFLILATLIILVILYKFCQKKHSLKNTWYMPHETAKEFILSQFIVDFDDNN